MCAQRNELQSSLTSDRLFSRGFGVRDVSGHKRKVGCVAWSSDGRRLASGGGDKAIRVWTLEPHSQVAKSERSDAEYTSHSDAVASIRWRPDHADVMASVSSSKSDTNVRFHDARTNKQTATVALSSDRNMVLSWAPDGTSLVVGTSANELVFIDTRKMKRHKQCPIAGHDQLYDVRWGPTQGHVTYGMDDGTVRVAAVSKPDNPIWRLQAHSSGTRCLAYSFNCKYLASGGHDGLVSLWDTDDMICLRTYARPDQGVDALDFSHDARWLAYTSDDGNGTIDVVDVQTGELGCSVSLRQPSQCLAWCPTALVLAFAGEDVTKDAYATVGILAPPKPA